LMPRVEEADATPVAEVTRTPEGALESVRLVVLAVPKKPVPETPKAVELPYVSVSRPAESNEEVAEAPKYALLYTERRVEEAPPVNWWRPVQVGAMDWESAGAASLRIAVKAVPFTAVRPMEADGLAKVTPVWQVPFTEKHPPARSMPRAKVLVAAVPVTLR